MLCDEGTHVVKLFLNVSKEEQRAAAPGPRRRPDRTVEVPARRPRRPCPVGRLPGGVRGSAPRDDATQGTVVRRAGRSQVGPQPGRRSDRAAPPDRDRSPVPTRRGRRRGDRRRVDGASHGRSPGDRLTLCTVVAVTVLVPTSLGEAVDGLNAHPGATLLAGGTDLMVEVNEGHRRFPWRDGDTDVIALSRVPELSTWTYDPLAGARSRWVRRSPGPRSSANRCGACCRRWPRRPARSGARRSAIPARSGATWPPARRRATDFRSSPHSNRPSA